MCTVPVFGRLRKIKNFIILHSVDVQASVTIPCRTATYLLERVHTHFFHPAFRAFPLCKFKKMEDKKNQQNIKTEEKNPRKNY
jgi:hypothetical protein